MADFPNFYAPNFEEVGGAYCFWGVRPSVLTLFDAWHDFRHVHATFLKFLIWIPREKKKKKPTCTFFFSTGL